MSAFGGKADIAQASGNVRLMTESGHRSPHSQYILKRYDALWGARKAARLHYIAPLGTTGIAAKCPTSISDFSESCPISE
jgi:hypothetical protein